LSDLPIETQDFLKDFLEAQELDQDNENLVFQLNVTFPYRFDFFFVKSNLDLAGIYLALLVLGAILILTLLLFLVNGLFFILFFI
jgi:hypothetical protein